MAITKILADLHLQSGTGSPYVRMVVRPYNIIDTVTPAVSGKTDYTYTRSTPRGSNALHPLAAIDTSRSEEVGRT